MFTMPFKYNSRDQIIEDSAFKTVVLVTWPGCKRNIEDAHKIGEKIVALLNENGMENLDMSDESVRENVPVTVEKRGRGRPRKYA